MQDTGDGQMNSSDSGTSPGKPTAAPDDHEHQDAGRDRSGLKNHPQQEHLAQSQGEPIDGAKAEYSGGRGASGGSRSAPERKPVKGILKNRDVRSPLTDDALNYSGPPDAPDAESARDNNYEEDEQRFSKLVDSRELHARKIKAGLVKKRVRNSSTESAPELTFYPKRQDGNDEDDDKNEPKGPPSYKPPLTV